MQILLIYSATPETPQHQDPYTSLLPIGLCSLFATLRQADKNVTLVNLSGLSEKACLRLISSTAPPQLIGLSQWTHNRHETLARARLLKKRYPDALIMLGGGHATHRAVQQMTIEPAIDLVALGEAEETLTEVVSCLEQHRSLEGIHGLVMRRKDGSIIQTAARQPLTDLDRLPFPGRWLREALNCNHDEQAAFISTSRGCPAACHFCASPRFWGRSVRARSVASVVDEMLYLQQQYGLLHISLRDDTFTADRERTIALCQELLRRDARLFWSCQSRAEAIDRETVSWMRRAGCECIQLGVESGSEPILKLLNKKSSAALVIQAGNIIKESGLALSIYLISAIPEETDQDKQLTKRLVLTLAPDDIQIAPLAYYPGTALFQRDVTRGIIREEIFEERTEQALLVMDESGLSQHRAMVSSTMPLTKAPDSQQLDVVIKRDGYHAVLAMRAGDAASQEGNRKKALAYYRQICDHEPTHPWGWLLMAEQAEAEGKYDMAKEAWQRLLTLVPAHQPAIQALQELTRMP